MRTHTRPHTARPARARMTRLWVRLDDYTRHTFNAQPHLRGRR